ncbi:hypothetical protein BX600DRAFT_401670 [Xylariales sp. PMI_506]|nr:hypothetical protein BX600DRAFT_401670 [Xylariales sp. PMI_506]
MVLVNLNLHSRAGGSIFKALFLKSISNTVVLILFYNSFQRTSSKHGGGWFPECCRKEIQGGFTAFECNQHRPRRNMFEAVYETPQLVL